MRAETDPNVNNLNALVSADSVAIDVASSFFNAGTSFDENRDFLSEPLDGSLFTAFDVNGGFDTTQDATIVTLDANLTTASALTITSVNATWQDDADDGVFLGTTLFGDFNAEMTVLSMDAAAGHIVGLMVRVPTDEGLETAGSGQDWVSICVTGAITQVVARSTDNSVTTELAESQEVALNFSAPNGVVDSEVGFRIQRKDSEPGDGSILQLEYKIGAEGEWIEADLSPVAREDMVGEALEVGIYQTTTEQATAIIGDFSIKDDQIFASGFD